MESKNNELIVEEILIQNEGSDNSDSHSGINKKKKSNIKTKLQLDKLVSFIQANGDFTKGKANESQLDGWDDLTDELNAMGPPYHSNLEWRKIWSDHKGNLRRKSSTVNTDDVMPKAKKVSKTVQSGSRNVEVQRENSGCLFEEKENQSIHSMFNGIVEKIDTLVEQHKETNTLLKELINVFKPQSVDSS